MSHGSKMAAMALIIISSHEHSQRWTERSDQDGQGPPSYAPLLTRAEPSFPEALYRFFFVLHYL